MLLFVFHTLLESIASITWQKSKTPLFTYHIFLHVDNPKNNAIDKSLVLSSNLATWLDTMSMLGEAIYHAP